VPATDAWKEDSMAVSKQEFVGRLAEALNEDAAALELSTVLADLEGWDSVGQLSAIALIDECFNRRVNVDELRKCISVANLLSLLDHEATG
jgi:acyl carrier protein